MLRTEHLTQEKKRRNAEILLKQKEAMDKYGAANRMRQLGKQLNGYTVDFSGAIVPPVPFHINKCKAITGPTIKAHISDAIINNTIDTNKEATYPEENIQLSGPNEEINSGTNIGNSLNEVQNFGLVDILKIEPSFGVELKTANEVKKGPNIMEDPKLVSRVTSGFHKSRSEIRTRKLPEINGPVIPQDDPIKNDNQMNLKQNLFVKNVQEINMMKERQKSAKNVLGTLPTGAVSYAKYKRSMSNSRNGRSKVITQKNMLARDMKLVEANSAVKNKRSLELGNFVIPKNSGRKSKLRSSLTTSHSKYRMAPPPIGKTIGHGIFKM